MRLSLVTTDSLVATTSVSVYIFIVLVRLKLIVTGFGKTRHLCAKINIYKCVIQLLKV